MCGYGFFLVVCFGRRCGYGRVWPVIGVLDDDGVMRTKRPEKTKVGNSARRPQMFGVISCDKKGPILECLV